MSDMSDMCDDSSERDYRLDPVDPGELVLKLQLASRALLRLVAVQTRVSGLGMLEFLVLSRATDPDGVTTGAAGRALGLGRSTMTGLSDRLEAENLVRRLPHPTDRRLVLLRATAHGKRVRTRALGPVISQLTDEAEAIGGAARVEVGRFLDRVIALVNENAEALQTPRRGPAARTTAQSRARP
jgi:DNA-binding MarR family transcriptional regulator